MVHVYRSRSHPKSARAMRYILQQHNSVPHISCMPPPCQSLGASRPPQTVTKVSSLDVATLMVRFLKHNSNLWRTRKAGGNTC